MKKIIIGARGSKLSKAYVTRVKDLLLENFSEIKIFDKAIKTSGDINNNIKLSKIGGKKLFCKEIEEELLNHRIDIAVHSLKDMESNDHKDLIIGAFLERNDPRDVLISKKKINKINDLEKDFRIGSSSRRRELQVKKINHKVSMLDMRGNIDTRIQKLEENKFDAIILAAAGVKSLKLENKISLFFNINEILPAAGQGVVAVQCRKKDKFVIEIINKINNVDAQLCATSERAMLQTIGGDCDTAVGALATITNKELKLKAQLFSDDGKDHFDYELSGNKDRAELIGKTVGEKLLSLAGKKFKKK